MTDGIAFIRCACGEVFQEIRESETPDGPVTDWDEAATAAAYYAHLEVCPCQS